MLIAVDAHALGCRLTGNEIYIRNLLREYAQLDQESAFVAYVSTPSAGAQVPPRMEQRPVSANPLRRLGWDIPRHLQRQRPDLLHVQYTGPWFCSTPLVVSVHDVSYLDHPEYFSAARALQLRVTVKRTVRQAARIIAPSEFSRRTILREYGVEDSRVVVVPNAVSPEFRPMPRQAAQRWVEAQHGIPGPFVLNVGDLQPRKNHVGLIRAFHALLQQEPRLPHRLVLVGKETWYTPEIRRAAAALGDRIHFAGWVSDAALLQFYAACDMLAFPSFYEGFGLPILEAMACGRAVACSRTTAFPEVAGAAARYFDPGSISEMAGAIGDVLTDAGWRSRLEAQGLERAKSFSWRAAARETLAVYRQVAGEARQAGLLSMRPMKAR